MRRTAFAALWVVLIAQLAWTAYDVVHAHPTFLDIYYPVLFIPAAAGLALTQGRARWWTPVPRLLIAAAFGVRVRLAAAGSALLLFLFATAMVASGLSQFQYSVYLMSVTAWALSTIDASALTADAVLDRHARVAA